MGQCDNEALCLRNTLILLVSYEVVAKRYLCACKVCAICAMTGLVFIEATTSLGGEQAVALQGLVGVNAP